MNRGFPHVQIRRAWSHWRLPVSILALLLIGALSCHSSPPSDQVLVEQFEEFAPTYGAIVRMLQEDTRVGTIGKDFLLEAGNRYVKVGVSQLGITSERLSKYKRLLSAAGIHRFDRRDDGTIVFSVSASGFAGNTHHKGILWTKRPPVSSAQRRYVPLRENWYLYQD